ncbi:hypothetical protein NUU61_005162 [Penicillium alfredii]|uniref:Tryptophan synthase beta chain-like PALP domain-containing protein n=1 Tax=Penicillium alfredii TaxID=1506179 RepID=A0A9W9K7X3_9EURO|nr:uncharacterized protein NUU61_005162 [Penicillium alfredii]KAJ5095806.1 hypothetical protein NUU61_005162 [Penicillium alfredii]
MKALADGAEGDSPVVCGESLAASMGVMLETSTNQSLREKLGLDSSSQVLLFGLEGTNDPEIYESLVGKASKTHRESPADHLEQTTFSKPALSEMMQVAFALYKGHPVAESALKYTGIVVNGDSNKAR